MSEQACRAFFDAWNRRAFDEAMTHVADDCHYNDFSFVAPHVGKASVRALFETPSVHFVLQLWSTFFGGKLSGDAESLMNR